MEQRFDTVFTVSISAVHMTDMKSCNSRKRRISLPFLENVFHSQDDLTKNGHSESFINSTFPKQSITCPL